MTPPLVEDYDAIRERRDRARDFDSRVKAMDARCAARSARSSWDCWCHGAADNGGDLPCPPLDAPDPLDVTRTAIKRMFGPPFWRQKEEEG